MALAHYGATARVTWRRRDHLGQHAEVTWTPGVDRVDHVLLTTDGRITAAHRV